MLLRRDFPHIAMLHSVSNRMDDSLKDWCISHHRFSQLLDFLEEKQYETTHFGLLESKNYRPKASKKIILTFDDCPKNLLDFAVPELLKRKMKAAFYIPTAYIGGYNSWDVENGKARLELMNEDDLKALSQAGMEIGSHSHRHIALKTITYVPELEKEVRLSKQLLESITGQQVYSFSYPYGSVPIHYREILSNAGYFYGLSIYQPFQTPLALRRFGVYEKDTKEKIKRKLSLHYRWLRSVYDLTKNVKS